MEEMVREVTVKLSVALHRVVILDFPTGELELKLVT